jgi:hypothetical protein
LLAFPGLARYLVRDGRTITVAPDPAIDPAALTLFTSGSPIAAILHQRGHICLHASAVAMRRGAILFVAPSGTGKSTLAAALAARGHRVVTDDIAAVHRTADGWGVAPGPMRLKLWPDSLGKLRIDPAPLPEVRPGLGKRLLSTAIDGTTQPGIAAIIGLAIRNEGGVSIERLPSHRAIRVLTQNTYRRRMREAVDGGLDANFRNLASLIADVPCFEVQRSGREFALDALADAIEGLVAEL